MTQTGGRAFRYEQIADTIQRAIEAGKWTAGDRLPPIRDLAQEHGCNYHTVRSALNLLLERGVIESRRGSGTYVKDLKARTPTLQGLCKTENIGIIIEPGEGGHFAAHLLKAIHKQAEKHNRALTVKTVVNYTPGTSALFEQFGTFNCRSIIIPYISPWQDHQVLGQLIRQSSIPVVVPDMIAGLERNCCWHPSLMADPDYMQVSSSCRYFQALGYEHIAFLGPSDISTTSFQRKLMEYSRFVNENGLPSYIGLVRGNDENASIDDYNRLVAQWSELKGKLAVICYFDELAIRLMTALHRQGFSIPEDVAILGHNNVPECAFADPPLSSVKCPYGHIANAMVTHALALSRGETAQMKEKSKPEFIIRDTCGGKLRAGERLNEILASLQ